MSISKKEVEHIAKLARLELSEKEKEKFSKELSLILEYINKLNKLKTEKVQPLYQTIGLTNKKDEDNPEVLGKKEAITKNAPKTKGDYFEVKPIFK